MCSIDCAIEQKKLLLDKQIDEAWKFCDNNNHVADNKLILEFHAQTLLLKINCDRENSKQIQLNQEI